MIEWRQAGWRTTAGRIRDAATAGGAPVTYGLIGVCGVVFLASPLSGFGGAAHRTEDARLAAQAAYFERWGVIPAELWQGSAHALITPFTALFVHGSWLHLLGNLLFLYVFGAMVEERMGRVGFTLFYVGCGYVALVCYAAAHADSEQTLVGGVGCDLRGTGRVPVPLPQGPGHQPVPVPLLPAAALPRLDRAGLLVRPPVGGGTGRGRGPRSGVSGARGGLCSRVPLRVGGLRASG